MLHESPPQQQQPSLSVAPLLIVIVFVAPSFMSHESPQQHSCFSDVVPVLLAASFIAHESPQQQHSCLSPDAL
jgi:hypothetical protein